jgi:hypothetical protein
VFNSGANYNILTPAKVNVTSDAGTGNSYQSPTAGVWNALGVTQLTFGNGATQFIKTGTTANTDIAGQITIASGTSANYNLLGTYTYPPYCQVTPISNPSSAGGYWVAASNTVVTVFVVNSTTLTFNYHCDMTH